MPDKHDLPKYAEARRKYRSVTPRHVLVLEADMTEEQKRLAFGVAEKLRHCGNELVAELRKHLTQLQRLKKYRSLKREYGRLTKKLEEQPTSQDIAKARKHVATQMRELQETYNVTEEYARKYMETIKDEMGVDAVFALTRYEDIWVGVEKILYGDGKSLHFKKRGDLPPIRAKQINRGIILSVENNTLYLHSRMLGKEKFSVKVEDKFQQDEMRKILKYLENPELNDALAVNWMLETGEIIDTFRPCYATLTCEEIRGKLRVYVHLMIEGRPEPKFKSDGISPRHTWGVGCVGADIGTQTVAYTSDTEVGLKNLAERGRSITTYEAEERRLLRKMDRSRRATNPGNYNRDGTVKPRKKRKPWVRSKRYSKTVQRHRELCRKNAASRKYAIREDANHLRELGDVLVTEPPNFKALQKRGKPKTVVEELPDGTRIEKQQRRKRFGKSVRNRCPGGFQASLRDKFEGTGGEYHEVARGFRASQYDHTSDDYVKKKLSQRVFKLSDGSEVQRDWYSSFLLYNASNDYKTPDRVACLRSFDGRFAAAVEMLNELRKSGRKVMNSGIV